jgi:penicillin amidase
VHHLLSQEPFTGVGASGLSFFPEPAALTPEDRRDVALLQALRDALDVLASSDFQEAFGNSTNQDDYRWGRLSRVTFPHPLGGPSSIPPAAGFTDLAPNLPGIPRDGGWGTVNVSNFSGVADGSNEFRFFSGSVTRFVMAPGRSSASGAGALGFNSIPGGSSGDPASSLYASQLGKWLTVDYHRMPMTEGEVRREEHVMELFRGTKD